MLHYTTFDDAWGAPIAPKITNPYRHEYTTSVTNGGMAAIHPHMATSDSNEPTESSDQPRTRSDEDICRDHLTTVYATQGPQGVRRVLGPHLCRTIVPKKPTVFEVDIDELMLFLFFGLVVYMLS